MKEIKQMLDKQKQDEKGKFGVHTNIFGTKGSGKTYKAREIVKDCFKKPVVYRMSNDFDDMDIGIFKPDNIYENLDTFMTWAIKQGKKKNIDAIIFDEADKLFPNKKQLSQIMVDLIDMHRHYNLSLVFITRRPQSLHTEIAEVAHFNLFFSIEGDNAFKKLNGIFSGLGDMVKTLIYKSYDFVFKEVGKPPVIVKSGNSGN